MKNDLKVIVNSCLNNIVNVNFKSYDLFDALTAKWIDMTTSKSDLLRRIAIQINSKSPVNLHWLGMKKLIHTKLISDLLWYYSLDKNEPESINIFNKLLDLKTKGLNDKIVWGLNFPYTSRFINATENTPNIYNTTTTGLAICEYLKNGKEEALNIDILNKIVSSLFEVFTFNSEGHKGWFVYYPGQVSPTYNVNALVAYFLCKTESVRGVGKTHSDYITKLVNLLVEEQNSDGSWFYSRSEKGKWIDGFHSGFVIESLAFVYSHGYKTDKLLNSLTKAWDFYINEMFTDQGYPKYFYNQNMYPIEAQNCAQAIQTLATCGLWMGWKSDELLNKVIENTVNTLYNKNGFFIYKKGKYFTYKQSYLRWSTAPMLVAFKYVELYKNSNNTKCVN